MPGPADYFQQGFLQLGQDAVGFENKFRDPHPAIKRRIMEMLHQGKSPQQAAIEAKLEMAGHLPDDGAEAQPGQAPVSLPPRQMEPYGDGSVRGMPSAPPPPRMAGQPMLGPPATHRLPTPEPTFSMRDANDAKDLGLLHDPRALTDTPEDRYARALLRATTQRDEGSANRDSREKQTTERVEVTREGNDAKLAEKQRQYDSSHKLEIDKLKQDWDKAVLRARTAITAAREGRASAKDVAALKAVLSYDSAIQAQVTQLAKTSYAGVPMGSSSELQKRLDSLEAQHGALAPQVQDALKRAEKLVGGDSGGESTSEHTSVSVPGMMPKAPDTSVPAGVGVAPKLPPRFRSGDGKGGYKWVKLNPATGKYNVDPNQGD